MYTKKRFFSFLFGFIFACATPLSAAISVESSDFSGLVPASSVGGVFSVLSAAVDFAAPASVLSTSNFSVSAPPVAAVQSVPLTITGRPLNYPNPFQLGTGTSICYILTNQADIQIRFYSMFGYLLAIKNCSSVEAGGMAGYNEVPISRDTFAGNDLSAGIYFYVIMGEGKVLGKGKMAVKP
jgi:hypothetical protein